MLYVIAILLGLILLALIDQSAARAVVRAVVCGGVFVLALVIGYFVVEILVEILPMRLVFSFMFVGALGGLVVAVILDKAARGMLIGAVVGAVALVAVGSALVLTGRFLSEIEYLADWAIMLGLAPAVAIMLLLAIAYGVDDSRTP